MEYNITNTIEIATISGVFDEEYHLYLITCEDTKIYDNERVLLAKGKYIRSKTTREWLIDSPLERCKQEIRWPHKVEIEINAGEDISQILTDIHDLTSGRWSITCEGFYLDDSGYGIIEKYKLTLNFENDVAAAHIRLRQ